MSKHEASEETSLALLQDILQSLRDESLPLTEDQERQLPSLIHAIPSQALASLGLSPPPRPSTTPKGLDKSLPIQERLAAAQGVINSLQCNHHKGYLFNVDKTRPFSRIMETAHEVCQGVWGSESVGSEGLGQVWESGPSSLKWTDELL